MNPQPRLDTRTRVARLVAVALLPILVLALLLTALWNPVDRLSTVRAAIVNLDEPVTVEGQYVPLGRQLAAGLISGAAPSTEQTVAAAPAGDTGYDWQITSSAQARDGLANGTFAAVVTIPPGFSAAATSMGGEAAQARQATIDVATPPGGRVADAVIARYVAGVATSVLGSSLTETYVDNVLVGFTTMSDQLGEAVDGATRLADGATSAADGATRLADGATQLADGAAAAAGGAGALADGAGRLADGATQLADGAAAAAGGAGELAGGADALAAGAGQVATGAAGIAGGIRESQAGAQDLATGVKDLAAGLTQAAEGVQAAQDLVDQILPPVEDLTGGLVTAAGDIQAAGTSISTQLTEQIDALQAMGCAADATEAPCSVLPTLLTLRAGVEDAVTRLDDTLAVAGQITAGLDQVDDLVAGLSDAAAGATALGAGVQDVADGLGELAGGAGQVAQGAQGLASGARDLATGARALSGGVGQVATGAGTLAHGTGDLADGTGGLASGIGDLATGADQIATGSGGLADGVGALADGVGQMTTGLGQAVDELPTYSDADRATLASVIANPVAAPGEDTLESGSTGPLFAVVALWLGALGLTTVVRPSGARLLGSTRGAARLAVADLAVPTGVGAITGAVVGAILAAVEGPSLGAWAGLVMLGALISVVFVVLHQGFTLLAGNLARGASLLIAVLIIATGVVATVPGWLVTVGDFLAVGAARQALVGLVVTGAGGTGAALVALVGWGLAGTGLTVLMTARARTMRVSRLLAPGAYRTMEA